MKAQNKKEHDPQVELLNLSKVQRSQEPSFNDDYESKKSDEEEDEEIFVNALRKLDLALLSSMLCARKSDSRTSKRSVSRALWQVSQTPI